MTEVPNWAWWAGSLFFFFWAMFQVWRKEYHRAEEYKRKLCELGYPPAR